jgi:hypothetical protein
MSLDTLFGAANLLALAGWICLAVAPRMPRWSDRIAAWIVPGLLAALYLAVLLAYAGGASGGFSTLDGVAELFRNRAVLLAGWVHYLAFDLAIGAWEVRDARRRGTRFAFVLPCLALTFLAGPVGWLLHLAVRTWAPRRA